MFPTVAAIMSEIADVGPVAVPAAAETGGQ